MTAVDGSLSLPAHRQSRLLAGARVLIGACIAVKVLVFVGVLHDFPPSSRPGRSSGVQWTWDLGTTAPSSRISFVVLVLTICTAVAVLSLLTQAYRRAGGPNRSLPVRRGWFVAAWLVPLVNLFAPYPLLSFAWDRLLGPAHRRLLRWWWVSWVAAGGGTIVWTTTPTEDGWQALSWPFAAWNSAMSIILGVLTVRVLSLLESAPSPDQAPIAFQG